MESPLEWLSFFSAATPSRDVLLKTDNEAVPALFSLSCLDIMM